MRGGGRVEGGGTGGGRKVVGGGGGGGGGGGDTQHPKMKVLPTGMIVITYLHELNNDYSCHLRKLTIDHLTFHDLVRVSFHWPVSSPLWTNTR